MKRPSACVLLAIAILATANEVYSQNIPGRWVKVALPMVGAPGNDNTLDFGFVDSLNGVWVSGGGVVGSTVVGGRTWQLDSVLTTPALNMNKRSLNALSCTGPRRGFYHSGALTLSILPGGTGIESPPEPNQVNDGAYFTLAEKMYDTAYGFRLVEYVSTHDLSEFDDSVAILVTHDGWRSSDLYGSPYIIAGDTSYLEHHYQPMNIGYIVDSNDVWTALGRNVIPSGSKIVNEPKVILHTTSGGATWLASDAFDSANYQPWVLDFSVNPTTREVFCFGTNSAADCAYSSDYGTTWRVDSTFGNGLWRLANPAHGVLWAIIGSGAEAIVPEFPLIHSEGFASKLAYSSDNGAHWLIDSTTFIDDSLEEMHFLNARHGWIASWSHDSLFMWYYDASSSGVAKHSPGSSGQFAIYPNPARSSITVSGAPSALTITDALGRIWNCPVSGQRVDVSQLPAGIYFICGGRRRTPFAKE